MLELPRIPGSTLIDSAKIGRATADVQDDFLKVGEGIIRNMTAQGFIKPDSRVLDVGCGLGRLARPLVSQLAGGSYVGIDVHRPSIVWCRENYADQTHFSFIHMDVFSKEYNPNGPTLDMDATFPVTDSAFDFCWSTSLFTHMQMAGTARYLKEQARALAPGARCWNTFLLLDSEAESNLKAGKAGTRWVLPHVVEGGRVRDLNVPEAQSALNLEAVRAAYVAAGLEITEIRFGPWSGRTENVRAGGQDVVIAHKPLRCPHGDRAAL